MLSILLLVLGPPVNAYPTPLQVRDQLFCTISTWETVITFFIVNYATHALTIKSFPGEKTTITVVWTIAAVLVPFSSIMRACEAIARGQLSEESDLDRAVRVGALCCVARSKNWRPIVGDEVKGCVVTGLTSGDQGAVMESTLTLVEPDDINNVHPVFTEDRKIHGQMLNLPEGYELLVVPDYIAVTSRYVGRTELSNTHNTLKYAASIIQLIFACVSLYRTRGDQITKFGYAAYGLTVIPYASMSFLNLIANICGPDYPSLYMVRSEVMEEAERRGGCFDGTIGEIDPGPDEGFTLNFGEAPVDGLKTVKFKDPGNLQTKDNSAAPNVRLSCLGRYLRKKPRDRTFWEFVSVSLGILALGAPYVIIGGLTHFNAGGSTRAQRGWTMSWLVLGQFFGFLMGTVHFARGRSSVMSLLGLGFILIVLCSAAPIGGLIAVGQMILSSETCAFVG